MKTSTDSIHTKLHLYLLSRKNFYQFLYTLFSEPINEEILLELASQGDFTELKEINEGGELLAAFFEQFTKEQIGYVKEEYDRLFVGPGSIIAPPWESYYRSKEHLLFEEWTLQIRQQYHQFGLKYIKENNEPEDHLLLELEFLIFLIDLSLQETNLKKVGAIVSSQVRFLEDHLNVWVPDFCKRIINNSNSQLYLGAAMLLEDFLNLDLRTLLEVRGALSNV